MDIITNVVETLYAVGATTKPKEKQALLASCDCEFMREILDMCYNVYRTFGVNKIDMPAAYNIVQPDIQDEWRRTVAMLEAREVTPAESRHMVRNLLSMCTERNAEMLVRAFKQDLKIGVQVSTVNKALGDYIPVFDVMLAEHVEQLKAGGVVVDNWHRISYPAQLEVKYDGMRIIAVCDGKSVKYFSREGLEYDTLHHLDKQIMSLREGTKFVLDGEVIGIKYNPNCKVAKKNHDAGLHWEFAQALSMTKSGNMGKGKRYSNDAMREHVGFITWDVIDYDYFMSRGKQGEAKPLRKRLTELYGLFDRCEYELPNLIRAEGRLAFSMEDIKAYTNEVLVNGGEGTMIKDLDGIYEFKRTFAVLKLKAFHTADLRVKDVIEGGADTQFAGMVGALVVEGEGIESEVGSFQGSSDIRLELWLRHLRGELIGTIHEIKYFEITADNSLRLPIWLRERPDKTTTSL